MKVYIVIKHIEYKDYYDDENVKVFLDESKADEYVRKTHETDSYYNDDGTWMDYSYEEWEVE